MTSTLKKLLRTFLVGLLIVGISRTLVTNVSARRTRYSYHHYQRTRIHKGRRHNRIKKRRVRGKKHFYWYPRYKKNHKEYINKSRHRRAYHKSKALRVAKLGSEVTYQDKDIDSMDDVQQMEYQTVKMINTDRAAHNLQPLRDTTSLRRLARKRASQLVDLGYLTHKDSKGRYYYEVDAKGMKVHLGGYSGENIASAGLGPILMDNNPHIYNNTNGKDMANMDEDEMVYHDGSSNWGHRYNTLNSHYVSMGIGAARKAGTNNYYLAENFSS